MRQSKFIVLGIALLLPLLVKAQTNCVQNLRNARNLYEEGRLNELPDLLTTCIESEFTKEEKVEALRLITLAHLYNENEAEAEASFLKLLQLDPEYEVDPATEPVELVILKDKFDTNPKFSFGVKATQSINFVQVMNRDITLANASPGGYAPSLNLSFGAFFQYPFTRNLSANIEIHYVGRSTSLERPIFDESTEDVEQMISETQQSFEVPLLINYKIPFKLFPLEITGGTTLHFLQSAALTLEGVGENRTNQDILPYRNSFNMSGVIGLRSEFKIIGRNYLSAEILYQHKLMNEVNLPAQMDELQLDMQLRNGHSEFDYKSHAILLRIGIRIPYFNPQLK